MADRRKDLARIHCLKKELGLDDDLYRDVLEQVAGQRSAGDLDEAGREAVIVHLARLAKKAGKQTYPGRPTNMQQHRSLKKVEALLADSGRPWSYAHAIAKRMFGRDRVQWCHDDEISAVIAALYKDAKRREERGPTKP
ncbi:MAG: regulatory protein GemA [Deltaproteobacteria bacterium]|nr:regulatory protein GemA [Deltaproteobacteria bacterium]